MKNTIPTIVTALGVSCLSASAYELHEWGTFTSVSGSDGVLLNGLHHEEERLPFFVRALDGMQNRGPGMVKGLIRPLKNVTIKMETPVIYFYSDEPFTAEVKVGFNGGSISQWYPERSAGETVPKIAKPLGFDSSLIPPFAALKSDVFKLAGGIDFSESRSGSIEWKVDVLDLKADRGLVFKPGETLNWLRPRNPKANVLKVGEQYEDYLFYRGVGNFPLPIKFTVDTNETLTISNLSSDKVPFMFVHEVTNEGVTRFHSIPNGLAASGVMKVTTSDLREHTDWHRPVYQEMFKGLTGTGLTAEESHGMIQTWWDSYFSRPGLRVFWVMPGSDTENILPLSVKPAPEKIVRTIVGRSEIIRPSMEQKMVKEFLIKDPKKSKWGQYLHDRFGHAYQQRVKQLLPKETAGK
ncbi:hypothetical protein NT6N_07730 [Oceaniferula spumae]|uniref:Uncharacterized protein n=1 Tax=Oceaniferula spumae TaxID=2979115 RepID=A0AAT9FID7_9BACT